MIGKLSKRYPQAFKVFLRVHDPFDVLWNDWNFIAFFVNTGMKVTINKRSYKLEHGGKSIGADTKDNPLEELIDTGFKLLERYIIENIQQERYERIR